MRKYGNMVIVGLVLVSSIGIFSIQENTKTHNGIQGRIIQASEEYDEVWELNEEDTVEEFIISLEGDWKEYSDKKYVPDIPDEILEIKQNTNVETGVRPHIEIKVQKGDIEEILDYLNPHDLNHKSITSKGWNMRYGITQIHLKLVPLANYYYNDFENNPQSQIDFLKQYIDTKTALGKTLDQVLKSYMTGEDY